MSYNETPAIKTGRKVGLVRLNQLILNVESADTPRDEKIALQRLKSALGCKGSREGVLRQARECVAAVKNW